MHTKINRILLKKLKKHSIARTATPDYDRGYITLLHAYAVERANTGYTYPGIISHLKDNGVNVEDRVILFNIHRILSELEYGQPNITIDTKENVYHYMLSDSYYRHLDYMEMKAAQANAKSAQRNAIIAIVITITLTATQIVIELQKS